MNRFLRLGGHNCRSAEFINKLILAKEAKNLDVGESVFSETSSDKNLISISLRQWFLTGMP